MKEIKKVIIQAVKDSIDPTDNQVSISVLNTLLDQQLPEQLGLYGVVKSLPTKKLMNFDDWLKFLKWEQVGNSYVYKQGNRYKDANELKQIHSTYLNK